MGELGACAATPSNCHTAWQVNQLEERLQQMTQDLQLKTLLSLQDQTPPGTSEWEAAASSMPEAVREKAKRASMGARSWAKQEHKKEVQRFSATKQGAAPLTLKGLNELRKVYAEGAS